MCRSRGRFLCSYGGDTALISYRVMKYNRIMCIACAIAVAFLTVFCSCVTASAKTNPFMPNILDPDINIDGIIGARPITAEEAQDAAYQIYGKATGIDKDVINGMLCFAVDNEHYHVKVYSVEYPDEIFDVITYLDDKHVYSLAFDSSVTLSDNALTAKTINDGVDNGLKMMTKTLNFLMTNPLCSLILGLSFTFFAFRLIRYGIKCARAI